MKFVSCEKLIRAASAADIGEWLEDNIPNPPLPEDQRWTLGYFGDDGGLGVKFSNEQDAIIFSLRWG